MNGNRHRRRVADEVGRNVKRKDIGVFRAFLEVMDRNTFFVFHRERLGFNRGTGWYNYQRVIASVKLSLLCCKIFSHKATKCTKRTLYAFVPVWDTGQVTINITLVPVRLVNFSFAICVRWTEWLKLRLSIFPAKFCERRLVLNSALMNSIAVLLFPLLLYRERGSGLIFFLLSSS